MRKNIYLNLREERKALIKETKAYKHQTYLKNHSFLMEAVQEGRITDLKGVLPKLCSDEKGVIPIPHEIKLIKYFKGKPSAFPKVVRLKRQAVFSAWGELPARQLGIEFHSLNISNRSHDIKEVVRRSKKANYLRWKRKYKR